MQADTRILRLIIQYLQTTGLEGAARELAQASGLVDDGDGRAGQLLRTALLAADWDAALRVLDAHSHVTFANGVRHDGGQHEYSQHEDGQHEQHEDGQHEVGQECDVNSRTHSSARIEQARFVILERKARELATKGNRSGALEVLRKCLSPMGIYPERLHRLASRIMQAALTRGERDAETEGDRLSFIQHVMETLRDNEGFALLPENRLAVLLERAQQWETEHCVWHNYRQETSGLLLRDHVCVATGRMTLSLPKMRQLWEHDCELWHISVSTDARLIALIDCTEALLLCSAVDGAPTEISPTEIASTVPSRTGLSQTLIGGIDTGDCACPCWPSHVNLVPCVLQHRRLVFLPLQRDLDSLVAEDRRAAHGHLEIRDRILAVALVNGNRAVVSSENQITMLLDIPTRTVLHSWIRLRASYLVAPRDANYFLAAREDGRILLISTAASEGFCVLRELESPERDALISSLTLSEDGKTLLVGCSNSTLYMYDHYDSYPQPTRIFRGHCCRQFRSSAVLADALVIGGSETGAILVWNRHSGRLLYELTGHEGPVNCIVSLGHSQFLSCGDDGRLLKWELP